MALDRPSTFNPYEPPQPPPEVAPSPAAEAILAVRRRHQGREKLVRLVGTAHIILGGMLVVFALIVLVSLGLELAQITQAAKKASAEGVTDLSRYHSRRKETLAGVAIMTTAGASSVVLVLMGRGLRRLGSWSRVGLIVVWMIATALGLIGLVASGPLGVKIRPFEMFGIVGFTIVALTHSGFLISDQTARVVSARYREIVRRTPELGRVEVEN